MAPATVMANGENKSLAIPVKNRVGINTTIITKVEARPTMKSRATTPFGMVQSSNYNPLLNGNSINNSFYGIYSDTLTLTLSKEFARPAQSAF